MTPFTIPAAIKDQIGTTFPALSPSEYEAMRAEWANSTTGNLLGVDCPICRNRGFVFRYDAKGGQICVECDCMTKRRALDRIKRSGLGDALKKCTFEAFQTAESWQCSMKDKAQDFVQNYSGNWFAVLGSSGAGKTHICTAICGELINAGLEVVYMRWRDDGAKLKALVNDGVEYEREIKPFKTAKVLYIDDLFKTQTGREVSQGDVNLAFELLNFRYSNHDLITIISSERTMKQLLSIDEATGSRIFERAKEYCVCLEGNKNFRLH